MAPPDAGSVERGPLLRWLIFSGLTGFALVLMWRFGLIRQMLTADRSYISLLIVLFYFGAALHCLWRTVAVSREADAARRTAAMLSDDDRRIAVTGDQVTIEGIGVLPKSLIAHFIRELAVKSGMQSGKPLDYVLLLRSFAARLRGSNAFGAFAGDTLMKLGLIGTIVGFIMMLAPIAGLDTADRGAIKSSMNLMSEGMAVAMYTTLAGLVASILVRVQYYMLEDATAKVFSYAVALVDVHVIARLDRGAETAA